MATIKRRKIPSGTLKLKQLKNDMPQLSSNQYKYVVEFPDGDRTDPRFTRKKGELEFDRVYKARKGGTNAGNSIKDLFGL